MILKKVKKKSFLKLHIARNKTSGYKKFTKEETEDFIENSYFGEWGNPESKNKNFPCQPERKRSSIVSTRDELLELSRKMQNIPAFAFDTETNGLRAYGKDRNFKCVSIQVSWGSYNNYMIPIGFMRDEDIDNDRNADLSDVVEALTPVFSNPYVLIVGNNLKFDLHVIKRIGIEVASRKLFDNQLASWICDENSLNGLKENSMSRMCVPQEHFNDVLKTIPKEVKKSFGLKANSKGTFDMVLINDAAPYAFDDPFMSWCLFLGFRKEIIEEGMDKIFYKKMTPFLHVLFDMEEKGITVDVARLEKMGEEMEKDLEDLEYKIYELAGCEFNISSSQQKAELLFGYRKPDKPIMTNKVPKDLDDLVQKHKDGKLTKNDVLEKLDKLGYRIDEKGKVFKKSKVNENLIKHSFHFPVENMTDSGNPSTDTDTIFRISMEEYKNARKREGVELCKYLLDYSKISKLKTAFVDGLLEQIYEDGKAHPSFNQTGTDSGRLSCSNPNLQQLPKADDNDKYKIRSVFIGSEYVVDAHTGEYISDLLDFDPTLNKRKIEVKRKKIIAIDYHNLEMVCLAHFSQDANLIKMFQDDDDAHGSTAVNMFSLDCTPTECKKKYPHLRQAAKTINFMLMYGGGAYTLYNNLKADHYSPLDLGSPEYLKQYPQCRNGEEVAQLFIDRYFESYKGVAKFISKQKRFAHKNGYVLTVLGRKRRLPDINSYNRKISSYNERLSVNSPVQGTAGDITISAQLRIDSEDSLKKCHCNMLIQVHDELVFECPEEFLDEVIPVIKHDMELPFGDNSRNIKYLRADYDTGDSYQEAK